MGALRIPASAASGDARRFVLEIDRRLGTFDRALLRREWAMYCGRPRAGTDSLQLRRTALLSSPGLLEWLRRALRRDGPRPVRRRLELLERVALVSRVEQSPAIVTLRGEVQRKILAYRPRWKGRRVGRVVVHRALFEGVKASDRKRAYYAYQPLHTALEGPLRELVRLRNAGARELGYRSFAEMRLSFDGLTVARLGELADAAASAGAPAVRELRAGFRERHPEAGWHPWDVSFARRDRVRLPDASFPRSGMVPRVLSAVDRWGFRTSRMNFRVVFHDLPSGGMTLAPDPPRDVRILVHPSGGWTAHMILFHEVGHAVHSASIRAPPHLLNWSEHIPGIGAFHEGIGGIFEEIPNQAAWLASLPGISRTAAQAYEEASRRTAGVDACWHAAWLRAEQELYAHPERDPMAVAARAERRSFGFDAYRPLSFVDPFFVESPIYAPNYLLALLFGAQVREAMAEQLPGPFWPNPRYGPWLTRNWFAAGSMIDWVPHLREVTGRRFGVEAFRRSLGA